MSEVHGDTIDGLMSHIYEGVLSVAGFSGFIEALIEGFQLKAAIMNIVNADSGQMKGLWMAGLSPLWMERYALEFIAEDVLAQHVAASPMAAFYASNLDLDEASFVATRFYQQWVRPQGVAFASGAIVMREGPWQTQLFLQRGPQQPSFTRAELAALNQMLPHLQRAIQMRQRFAELEMGQDFLTRGLDVLAMPTILMDEFGRLAHQNQSARKILERRNDIWVEEGHLFCRSAAHTVQLNLEITKAIQASRGCASDLPGVVLLPRTGQKDFILLVSPLHGSGPAPPPGGARRVGVAPAAGAGRARALGPR
ncbi:MAG: hypothetical protein ACEQSK_05775, partial [Sphingomonadaceae bacterium]